MLRLRECRVPRSRECARALTCFARGSVLKHADPRGQERARKLRRASSRGPEAPIVVYNDPARSRGQTRSLRRRTGCSNKRFHAHAGDTERSVGITSRQASIAI
ncbi:hypothetical protein IEO21_08082 [Rhodonia placenta]|uniref:Uncharacterized protein n=1 Tax=Rhodonia placenta TaxID=104341 RepID=A0A8H7NWW7_9APHY|nr:hypothetical protein IEO21_08082 [Postia placenta]